MIYGTFIQSPYFWYLISGRQKTYFFLFLMFQGPKRRPNDLEIYEHQFLEGRRLGSEGSKQAEARGPKEGGPRGQGIWPRGTHHLEPRGSVAIDLFAHDSVLT